MQGPETLLQTSRQSVQSWRTGGGVGVESAQYKPFKQILFFLFIAIVRGSVVANDLKWLYRIIHSVAV